MQIGIGLPNPIPGVEGRTLVEWASRAEARGFSSLATIDRIAFPSYESLVSLAAAAAVTERVGLLTNILLATTRSPVLLAKEAASVDQLSAGRLTLGMAVGGRKDDFEATGTEFEHRGKRFDEDLELMHNAWKGNPVIGGCDEPISPLPTNGTNVPIVFGGTSDQAIERVVKYGIGWTAGGAAPDAVGPFAEKVRAAWKNSGRPGEPKIIALSYFSVGDDVVEASKQYILRYYAYLGDKAQGFAEYGVPRTPEAIKETVSNFVDAGVDELILDPTIADLKQVDLLADVVL
jgi:alkanesulfonate monooxygenase SsuD/methylene tetrahydromethanopterin reductase-like flavin-dependent oxidoreductase (luciferase family)